MESLTRVSVTLTFIKPTAWPLFCLFIGSCQIVRPQVWGFSFVLWQNPHVTLLPKWISLSTCWWENACLKINNYCVLLPQSVGNQWYQLRSVRLKPGTFFVGSIILRAKTASKTVLLRLLQLGHAIIAKEAIKPIPLDHAFDVRHNKVLDDVSKPPAHCKEITIRPVWDSSCQITIYLF